MYLAKAQQIWLACHSLNLQYPPVHANMEPTRGSLLKETCLPGPPVKLNVRGWEGNP